MPNSSSSYRGKHKDQVFMIYFERYSNGYTAVLDIEGLPRIDYRDKCWRDFEEAKTEIILDATSMIEQAF